MNKIKLNISELKNLKEAKELEKKIGGITGVKIAKVNNETGKAVIIFDENKITGNSLNKKVELLFKSFEKKEKENENEQENKGAGNRLLNRDVLFGLVSSVCFFSIIVNIFLAYIILK